MDNKQIAQHQKESKEDVIYNEYYIKDIKSKIKKYIEIGDEKFIRALKALLHSDDGSQGK